MRIRPPRRPKNSPQMARPSCGCGRSLAAMPTRESNFADASIFPRDKEARRHSDFRARIQHDGADRGPAAKDYPAEIAVVVSNRPDAPGLARARAAGIATAVVDHAQFGADREAFERALDDEFR